MAATRRAKKERPRQSADSEERQNQLIEGRVRKYMDSHAEQLIHEEARGELHRIKLLAVDTLERSMLNTGACAQCGFHGLLVDKSAVQASLGVLDRAGLPPRRDVHVEDRRQVIESDLDIAQRAVGALVTLEPKQIGAIVQAVLTERQDARQFVVGALEAVPPPALLAEGVVVEA